MHITRARSHKEQNWMHCMNVYHSQRTKKSNNAAPRGKLQKLYIQIRSRAIFCCTALWCINLHAHTIWSCVVILICSLRNLWFAKMESRAGRRLFLFYAGPPQAKPRGWNWCLSPYSPRALAGWRSACTILSSFSLLLGGCRCIKMTNVRHFVKTPPLHLIAFKIIEFSVSPSRWCTRHLRCAPGLRWFCRGVIFCPRDINKEKDLA